MNFIPTLNSSEPDEPKISNDCISDYCPNFGVENVSSSDTETDDDESDGGGDSSDAKASSDIAEVEHHSPSQCSELARKQAECSKNNISGIFEETIFLICINFCFFYRN